MNDITRRFLNGVLERVPESRVVEVRLFPAMRQGGVESGIAVLAVEQGFDAIPDATASLEMDDLEVAPEVTAAPGEQAVVRTLAIADGDDVGTDDLGDDGSASWPVAVRADDAFGERERAFVVTSEGVPVADLPSHEMADATVGDVERELETEVALADVGVSEPEESIALGDILALPEPEPTLPVRDPQQRLAILCARYRLVLKGPDRGKWELEVVHQADAPLATLDRVISGVVRRSGETAEPERLNGESLRARLDAPPWVEGAAA